MRYGLWLQGIGTKGWQIAELPKASAAYPTVRWCWRDMPWLRAIGANAICRYPVLSYQGLPKCWMKASSRMVLSAAH